MYTASSQWRNAWLIKNTDMIGHQVSYTWWSFWQQTEVVSSPLSTLGTSSSGFASCHVSMSKKERAALPPLVLVQECKRISSADLSGHCRGYWACLVLLQKVHSCQQVARVRPTSGQQTPPQLPVQALSSPCDAGGWRSFQRGCTGCSIHQPQLPEQLHNHILVIIDNYHHCRVVTEMCWALGQTLV